jgi:hypothetical protein
MLNYQRVPEMKTILLLQFPSDSGTEVMSLAEIPAFLLRTKNQSKQKTP